MRSRFSRLCLRGLWIAFVLTNGTSGQRRNFPQPPDAATANQSVAPKIKIPRKLDTIEMEREAHELSTLAASIPGDVDQLKRGLLPKDAMEKLKRIEKLSKHLRSQIQ